MLSRTRFRASAASSIPAAVLIWGGHEPVTKIAFDGIVDRVTDAGANRVRLLKLDCEGSESPVLLTSQRLGLVDEICGEFHEIGGRISTSATIVRPGPSAFALDNYTKFTIDELVAYLEQAGFTVTHRRHRRPTGSRGLVLFFATRKPDEAKRSGHR